MARVLKVLSDGDPAIERVMELDIGKYGWQFKYNHQRIFITSFARCYDEHSPRYAFGETAVYILFQPEFSFSYHAIPTSTKPRSVRHKIRQGFEKAGRPYEIPKKADLMPHIYVKPLNDIKDPRLDWWLERDNETHHITT